MRKKLTFLLALCILLFLPSCNKTTPEKEENGRKVTITEIGLQYYTPEDWKKYEETNLYPLSMTYDNVHARVIYSYITDNDMKNFNRDTTEDEFWNILHPICEIAVLKSENVDTPEVSELFARYEKAELAKEGQNGYVYYVLSGIKDGLLSLTEEELAEYKEMLSVVPELKDSILTFSFDDTKLDPVITELNNYITFESKTLEGEKISSLIFGDHDVTMVNFWGTYSYPDINEQSTLQEVYDAISDDKRFFIISAVIDTPSKETEATALKAKSEAGGKFTSIVMDEILANWVTNNLKGIPTTVFVDNNGKIIGAFVEGAKDSEFYINELEARYNSRYGNKTEN